MKSTLSVVVITCLIASPGAGCATARGPRQVDEAVASSGLPIFTWSRVGQLAPGAAILVTPRGSEPQRRYFVMADKSRLIALNLSDPALPAASTRVLRDMAANYPKSFAALETTGTLAQGNVRIGREGVFVANRRVADLQRVVETVSKDNISEIWGPVVARGSALGTVVGGWIGFAVGVVPGLGGASEEVTWLVLIGATAAGGYLGFRWSSHETEGLFKGVNGYRLNFESAQWEWTEVRVVSVVGPGGGLKG